MCNFKIKELKTNIKEIKFDKELKGFTYKFRNNNSLQVKEILIMNKEIINDLIRYNFDKKYRKVLESYLTGISSEEDGEGSLMLALDEIARIRNIIIQKYKIFLNKKTEEDLLKKLKILENEIRTKIIDIKLIKEAMLVNNNIEEKCISR